MGRTLAAVKRLLNREGVSAALILVGLLHLCFFSCIWGNKTLLESARDQSSIMPQGAWAGKPLQVAFPKMLDTGAPAWVPEPLLALIGKDYLKERSVPLWNPYQAYGSPLAADMQSQPFYPLSIALSLHLTPRTYSWFILLRLFLAGICAYLFIRLFVSFVPALAAGVTSMFAGYFILFITMPHLSVEVLLPAALLAVEHLLRRPGYWTVVWFSFVIFLVMVGGMPESSLLLLSFLYLYVTFRIAADLRLRSRWLHRIAYMLLATAAGLALSAFLLLPFREYMNLAFDTHQPLNIGGAIPGLAHDPRGLSILTYFFPLLYGPPFSSALSPGWNGLRNYVGLISVFLSVMALFGSSWRRGSNDRLLSSVTCFFSLGVAAVVLKRYGFALINLVGALPLFKLVQFTKYDEVILSICVSMLCAIGLERMSRHQVPVWAQTVALGMIFLSVPLTLLFSRKVLKKEVIVDHIALHFPLWTVGLPVCLLFCVALVLIIYSDNSLLAHFRPKASVSSFATVMLILLTGESVLTYIIPVYYGFDNRLPTRADNPYLGAPFIHHLQAKPGRYRLFAEDAILFPNWASAFGLFDIRDLDAMYYNRYFPFLRTFFPPKTRRYGDELEDRFTGQDTLDVADFLQRRLLQLSSVKYLITIRPITEPGSIVEDILKQTKGHIVSGKENFISSQKFILDGVVREALGEHPPYDRLPYNVLIDKKKENLHFSYALNPAVFEHTCGDGVEFVLEAKDTSGTITKLFSHYIDPKHNPTERHWVSGMVDLRPYIGRRIQLLLSTNGGPKGDTCNDWAAWSNFHYNEAQHDQSPFKLVYDHEVKMYQYTDVLPRATIYHTADIKESDADVLRTLADPNLDVFHSVVLDHSALDEHQLRILRDMNSAPPSRMDSAQITSYESQAVTIEATLERQGILVLNDSNYPGWEVEVDGHKHTLLRANYLFRGVSLTSGKHIVRFLYKPRSFRLGVMISMMCLSFIATWGLIKGWVRHRRSSLARHRSIATVIH